MTAGRPVRIAHAYGNRPDRLSQALAADVDMIELDVWFHGGDVHVRHEHRLGRLPLLVDRRSRSMPVIGPRALRLPRRYYLRPDFRPLRLRDVLEAVDGKKRLLVDVKALESSRSQLFAEELVRQVEQAGAAGWTMVCGYWPVLNAVRETAPQIEVRYTVDTPKRLNAYLERLADGRASAGICAYYRLLSVETVGMLAGKGVDVYAWTVDDAAEAAALVERGVGGITSNDLGLLAGLGGVESG